VSDLRVIERASLRALNTFGIDARADRLVVLERQDQVEAALAACGPEGPALVLGGGSNLLITRDIPGAVLQVALSGRDRLGQAGDDQIVEAAAGENWHGFVQWTLAQGLAGLENLSLIPGTAGASPIQNIGAYGVEMRERFTYLTALDRRTGSIARLQAPECRFGYRDSLFKHPEGRHWLILKVAFRLSRCAAPVLSYPALADELARQGIRQPTAVQVSEAVCAIRRARLPDPARLGNAGSFFKNPVVDAAVADALRENHPGLPVYADSAPGRCKLSAAWLIDRCGWKGRREGPAGVHAEHALVLINHGGATGEQILALARRIQDSVADRFGIALEMEPVVV
jgi:UDP-N-acetylmuramate dehydrogenase